MPNQHMRYMFSLSLIAIGAVIWISGLLGQLWAQGSEERVPDGVILGLDGAVTPTAADYLTREIALANDQGADLVIIEIDTPGGLVTSMQSIVQGILASDIPVATYVAPQGARSASAGLYIMYGAHISAMAPATNTGAATPIQLTSEPPDEPTDKPTDKPADGSGDDEPRANPLIPQEDPRSVPSEKGTGDDAGRRGDSVRDGEAEKEGAIPADKVPAARQAPVETPEPVEAPEPVGTTEPVETDEPDILGNQEAARAKAINDSAAYIRSLAEDRGRNAEWAEKAVREAASITAREALELNVIDLIATDRADLLRQIDGRTVKTAAGEVTLQTDGMVLREIEPTLLERILGFLADPNVAAILLSLGTTGIIIEMWNPGSVFPGVFGALCLVFAFYSFQVLPFRALPLAIMGLGLILILIEAYTPTFGVAGTFGLLLFGGGLYMLFPGEFRISLNLLFVLMGIIASFLLVVLIAIARTHGRGALLGHEAINGREGRVDEWDNETGSGHVIVEGERWRARSQDTLASGDSVTVTKVDGLVLHVKAVKSAAGARRLMPRALLRGQGGIPGRGGTPGGGGMLNRRAPERRADEPAGARGLFSRNR